MNTELRELDAWIAENVMGLKPWKETQERITCILEPNEFVLSIPSNIVRARICSNPTKNFQPTIDAADSLEVLKKCVEMRGEVKIFKAGDGEWVCRKPIGSGYNSTLHIATATTLELAICRFASKLFEKQ